MYEFYYNYLKKKYADKIKLCYTDYVKNTNRPIAVGIDKKVLGMMKDKLDNNEMVKSVNACAKLYSYLKQ